MRQYELRYWDGSAWTEHTHNYDQPGPSSSGRGGVASVGEWLSATLAQITGRAGHIFTLILVLSLLPSTAIVVAMWWAFGDGVLRISDDPDLPVEFVNFDTARLWIAGVVIVVSTVVSLLFGAAVARQTVAAANGAPVPWSTSLGSTFRRAPRIFGVGISWFLLLILAYLVGVTVVVLVGVFVPILLLAAVPVLIVGMVFVVLRVILVPTAAALGPRTVGSWSAGLAAARPYSRTLFWRGLTALALSAIFQMILSTISSAIFGGQAETIEVTEVGDFAVTEMSRDNLIGQSFLLLLASSLVFAVVGGFAGAFRTTGLALSYVEFDGSVDDELTRSDPTDAPH